MSYKIKSKPEDFVVEELIAKEPEWKWDVLWVFFEKENLTTMEILKYLENSLQIQRADLGIAGLKDKVGITRQRITIYHSRLEKLGWSQHFISILWEKVKVLKYAWGNDVLKVWGNSGNRFRIVVKFLGKSLEEKDVMSIIKKNIEKVKKIWFPNAFGWQRFGKWMKNFWTAKEILENKDSSSFHSLEWQYAQRFTLQAYASGRFNEYVMRRREKGQMKLEGDDGKWPMLGWDLKLAEEGSKVRIRENQLLKLADFGEKESEACRDYNLMSFRRKLWIIPENLSAKFEGENVVFGFDLPSGSYATVCLGFLLDGIDERSKGENKLDVPRVEV